MTLKLNIQYGIKILKIKATTSPFEAPQSKCVRMSYEFVRLITQQLSRLPLENPKKYSIFNVALVANHKVYYKEINDATSKWFGSCESSKVLSCP